MSDIRERMIIIAAVAVTAAVCIGGMYLILNDDTQKPTVRVTVHGLNEAEMISFFADFGSYAKATVQVTAAAGVPSFTDDTDIIMTAADISFGAGFVKKDATVSGVPVHIHYREGADGMVGVLINWIVSEK